MERTLQVLNELERSGVLGRYAIGGAVGAMFYIEPVMTDDLDVFVVLPRTGAGLLTLSPIYDALRLRGYSEEGAFVRIEGIAVQFLPAYDPLVEEALEKAKETKYESVPTRVLSAEYLIAIALMTGREKDRDRVRMLREQASIDKKALDEILARHGLTERWRLWAAGTTK